MYRIPPFRPQHSKRRVSQRDRFVFFDLGVRNALLGTHRGPSSNTEQGHLFEQWIFLQCLAFMQIHHKEWKISSYRTEAGVEVDLILDTGKKLLAVECKYGANIHESELRGLRSFAEVAHKPVQKIIVYRGEHKQKFSDGELAIPYQEFLADLLPTL